MSFSALMYHELRSASSLNPNQPSPIKVRQDYEDQLPAVLFVTVENFESQMAYLYEMGYHTLSLDEIKAYYYEGMPLPDRSVLLSFDDCYQSIYHHAYPILKKYGFQGVVFVVTGWVNKAPMPFDPSQSVCLSETELQSMSDVFDYANHTALFHTRTSLTSNKLTASSQEAFAADLDLCNQYDLISAKDVFAYPFGLFNDGNVETLKSKAFKLGFTSEGGANLATTNPLLLKRYVVPHFMPLDSFKEIVTNNPIS